jgi:putative sigma-54 modulation protein
MNTQIQSIHFKADAKLKDYIEKKLEKLTRYYGGIIDSQVYLKLINTSDKQNKEVEIKINAKHGSLIKTQIGTSFEAATDLAVDALSVQVKRFKGKLSAA